MKERKLKGACEKKMLLQNKRFVEQILILSGNIETRKSVAYWKISQKILARFLLWNKKDFLLSNNSFRISMSFLLCGNQKIVLYADV